MKNSAPNCFILDYVLRKAPIFEEGTLPLNFWGGTSPLSVTLASTNMPVLITIFDFQNWVLPFWKLFCRLCLKLSLFRLMKCQNPLIFTVLLFLLFFSYHFSFFSFLFSICFFFFIYGWTSSHDATPVFFLIHLGKFNMHSK